MGLDVRTAFGWVRRLAAVPANKTGIDAAAVRRRSRGLIAVLARHRGSLGSLSGAFDPFRKVTRSCWPGRFRCSSVADLPGTTNDLEQFVGSYRYHERRCSGRTVAGPGTVVRGSVRRVAAAATRLRAIEATDLVPSDLSGWRDLRGRLEQWQAVRTRGRRFRRDPPADLKSLEDSLINQTLPP
jgi:hypothetical protein